MTAVSLSPPRPAVGWINSAGHRVGLNVFMGVVLAHWAEHLVQAYQVFVLAQPRPQSRGVLGQFFPWLVTSEWLHYGYAIVMVLALWVLRKGFVGKAKVWWTVAFAIQFWHHIEHLLLLIQAQAGVIFFGQKTVTSIAQLVIPRVELHLLYNTIVFIPMVIAVWYHLRPKESEVSQAVCTCAKASR